MSHGCGTLANPANARVPATKEGSFAKGTKNCASGNGKQHQLPTKTMHSHVHTLSKDQSKPNRFAHTNHPDMDNVDTHWEQQLTSTKGPARLNASQTPAQLAQSEHEATVENFKRFPFTDKLVGQKTDGSSLTLPDKFKTVGGQHVNPAIKPKVWSSGEHWNLDSNIRKWTNHEMKRNAAGSSHDVHRHDQIQRFVLVPQKDGKGFQNAAKTQPRLCMSGAVSSDCCFLEAWGFDLGARDRQAKPAPLWKPVSRTNQFRGVRSFDRPMARAHHEFKRSLFDECSMKTLTKRRESQSLPDFEQMTLKPEDIAGDVPQDMQTMLGKNTPVTEHGGQVADDIATNGRSHNSRSCNFHDSYNHAVAREAAKQSCAIHSPVFTKHREDYPFVDIELRPAAIYSRKFQEGGLLALRGHEGNSRHVPMKRERE